MKYRVTEKHPAYKEGLEIINNSLILTGTDDWGDIYDETITDWLKEGWIEEIQEPEFNEKDMEKAFEAGGSFRMACKNLTDKVIDKTEWANTEDFVEFMKSNYEKENN